tara:strand:+ start:992 stop:1273 length:282 start_codon:yes stop_codon:yes gene_type:complete
VSLLVKLKTPSEGDRVWRESVNEIIKTSTVLYRFFATALGSQEKHRHVSTFPTSAQYSAPPRFVIQGAQNTLAQVSQQTLWAPPPSLQHRHWL